MKFYWLALALVWIASASAQDRPSYSNLRYDEDWRTVAHSPGDKWHAAKHVSLGDEAYFSLGGDARVRYEYFRNPGFGGGRQDSNGYGLQRYLLHSDLRIHPWWRVFGQLQHSQESGRTGGPRSFDENKLDVHQAFVDVGPYQNMRDYTALRLGRQELEFPFARLMSVRDGRNTRITFQGARFIHQRPDWRGAMWALRPVRIDRNEWDETQLAGGAGYTRYRFLTPKGNIAIAYNLFNERLAKYEQGSAAEHRHGLGARIWGVNGGFDYNYEAVYQFGNFGDASIRAWDLATDTGYTWHAVRFQPRLGVRFDITSGDSDLSDDRLENFNPLFAATAYSGLAGLIGPSNAIDFAPSITLKFSNGANLTFGTAMFWRHRTQDGVYDLELNLIRSGKNSNARFVGQQWTLQGNYPLTAHASLAATLSYFDTGRFLRETGAGKNLIYFTTWWNYRF
jgi:Alginate export